MKKLMAALALSTTMLSTVALAANQSELTNSYPGAGQVLAGPPPGIGLEFDQANKLVGLELQTDRGEALPINFAPSDELKLRFEFPLPERLEAGTYAVQWTVENEVGEQKEGVIWFMVSQ
ncbi:copper resistance CopC family protein [Salinibius halmophilus]|uniref:copper resistance CopC family protein n=1 Tax=Salinibius halmophilus TaxID=1853216 RepID=UPI000E65F373|nr:copper resistance protein CopC [Salinibius halmophilus]